MSRLIRIAVLMTVGIVLTATAWSAPRYRSDVIIVKLKPTTVSKLGHTHGATATGIGSLDLLHVQFAATRFERTVPSAIAGPGGHDVAGLSRYYTVHLPPGSDVELALEAYAADPEVELAELDYIMPLYGNPNDEFFGDQWTHWFQTDKDIDTPEAWDLEVGDSSVIVGIIDSGFLYDHEDLKWSTWVNPGEDLDGDGIVWDEDDLNGVDDDGNGYVDDLVGYDFMPIRSDCFFGVLEDPTDNEDCNGPDNDPVDFNGHGTHVGGIVGATTGNGIGVAGVAGGMRSERRPGVKLMGLRAGYSAEDGNGFVMMSACAEAFDYAVAHGASILNCSWGSSGSLIQTAANNAMAANVVITKAAGNDNNEVSDILALTPGVITVSSLTKLGSKAPSSSFGSWVDISAPGDEIINTFGAGGIGSIATLGGTSMAAPTVAGVAALLKSHHSWLTVFDIDTILNNTVDDVYANNPAFIGKLGSGRVNAFRALQAMTTADFDADTSWGDAPFSVNFTNGSPNAPSGPYSYTFGDGATATTADASHTYNDPGLYDVTFSADGPTGPHTRVRPEMIVVLQDTVEYGELELAVGQTGQLPVRMRNSHPMRELVLPFKLIGSANVQLPDPTFVPSAVLAGWTLSETIPQGIFGKSAWVMQAGPGIESIPPGSHVIGHLNVQVVSGIAGAIETVDSATLGFSPTFSLEWASNWVRFQPHFVSGSITLPGPQCACDCLGDPECDGVTTVLDVAKAVNVAFRNFPAVADPNAGCPNETSDTNCDGVTSVIDVATLVNVAFRNADAQVLFCDPCP